MGKITKEMSIIDVVQQHPETLEVFQKFGLGCIGCAAARFENAGALTNSFVLKNLSSKDIMDSVKEIAKAIDQCQILAIPGGFSGADEPDGSGKFIATVFSNPYIKESIENLLEKRDGLILGICNGFQALIKLGLVPYGKISPLQENSPTLTFNNIGRHISRPCHSSAIPPQLPTGR